jgi:hypothetical protein
MHKGYSLTESRKYLRYETVRKAFIKRGWTADSRALFDYILWWNMPGSVPFNVSLQDGLMNRILVEGARWKTKSRLSNKPGDYGNNIHINSYWWWPRTLKDLEVIIDEIERVYSTLCGTQFPKKEKHDERRPNSNLPNLSGGERTD